MIQCLQRIEEGLLLLLVVALVMLACGQIFARTMLAVTFTWVDPFIRHLVLWIGMMGAMIATRSDKHIRIDALLRFVPPRLGTTLTYIGIAVSSLVCCVLAVISVRFVLAEMQYGTRSFIGLPTWMLQTIFPLAFAVMALRFLRRIADYRRQS